MTFPFRCFAAWALIVLALAVPLILTAPVAADDIHYDTATKGDVDGKAPNLVGSSAPQNADADPQAAAMGVQVITGMYVGACIPAVSTNGIIQYQETIFTINAGGYSSVVKTFTDPLCTMPVPGP